MHELLSPGAQQLFNSMDVDATFFEWNIQATDSNAFDELVKKGYLVKINDDPAKYKFADDVVAEQDRRAER